MVESSEELKTNFLEFSQQINADDDESVEETWELFEKIKYAYSLEGNQLHWLMCLLYNVVHKNKLLASDEEIEPVKSLSLARILRIGQLTFRQFLSKTRKLQTILNFPKEFCEELNKIERRFNVTSIIFSKYKSIYLDLFKNPFLNDDPVAPQKRTRNSKKPAFKSDDLFKFCWLLFIYVKEKFPAIGVDLVNSYNLLLCCINLVYINVLANDRHDLFNMQLDVKKSDLQIFTAKFDTEEDDDDENNVDANQSINLIIDYLCQHYDGLLIETKTINEHYFKTHIKCLILKKILYGSPITFLGLVDCNRASSYEKSKFELNCKNLNANYEEYIIKYGDIDERIFLNCIKDSEYFNYHAENYCFRELDSSGDNLNTMKPITANAKSNKILIPGSVCAADDENERMLSFNLLVKNREPEMSDGLNQLMASLDNQKKNNCVDFVKNYVNDNLKSIYLDAALEAANSYDQALTLYFKMVENILVNEKRRLQEDCQVGLSKLMLDEVFHRVLFACCIEIVHFSMNSETRTFPWILDTFSIEPFNLLKIIEIFIKSEELLSREQIRHLNSIEIAILESLVWKDDSIVWSIIKRESVPAFEDVCIVTSSIQPTTTSSDLIINLTPNTATSQSSVTSSPGKHPAITRVVCSNTGIPGTSTNQTSGSDLRITSSQIKKSDTIITTTTTTNLINKFHHNERIIVSAPLTTKRTTVICAHPQSPNFDTKNKKRKSSSSLAIFFRKFYNLATIRINLLLESLEIPELVSKKIWNIFEYSIKNHAYLLKDRHLDQLIMCAISVTCKVCTVNRQFQDIIRSYRIKSNTNNSHVYRSIFIKLSDKGEEIRGDLIQFYNEVYIEQLKSYALKLATYNSRVAHNIQLSPVPKINIQTFSPRKIIDKQSVYVSPLKTYQTQGQRPKLVYSFNSSTYKDLEEINEMIKRSDLRVKTNKRRLLSESENEDESDSSQNKLLINSNLAHLTKKLQGIKNDRLTIQQ